VESPQSALREWITPSEQFYVRNHFAEPDLKRSTWRLKVEGAVKKPGTFSYRDLTAMASQSQVAVIECAGNGRVFLARKSRAFSGNRERRAAVLSITLVRRVSHPFDSS
jgi:DMSO/TMAO reductase YedYZ molybdopterin-dependent catalytic subunit